MPRLRSWLDPGVRSSPRVGLVSALVLIAAVTVLIFPLKRLINPPALEVLYIPVVLLLTATWGVPIGIFASDHFDVAYVADHVVLEQDAVAAE